MSTYRIEAIVPHAGGQSRRVEWNYDGAGRACLRAWRKMESSRRTADTGEPFRDAKLIHNGLVKAALGKLP